MKDFKDMEFNPDAEAIVEYLKNKTQNNNPLFYRILVAYHFCLAAAMMRVNVSTHDRGDIPINLYAINLAPSGAGL